MCRPSILRRSHVEPVHRYVLRILWPSPGRMRSTFTIFSNSSIIPPGFKFTELHTLTLATLFYALFTRVYGIAPSKCPFLYQYPLPLVWFCYHRSQVSECKHCNCEVTFLTLVVSGVEKVAINRGLIWLKRCFMGIPQDSEQQKEQR